VLRKNCKFACAEIGLSTNHAVAFRHVVVPQLREEGWLAKAGRFPRAEIITERSEEKVLFITEGNEDNEERCPV